MSHSVSQSLPWRVVVGGCLTRLVHHPFGVVGMFRCLTSYVSPPGRMGWVGVLLGWSITPSGVGGPSDRRTAAGRLSS